jgi:adenosylcobyric acid synthase
MIQGTASNVGKTWVVAALCRAFARRGLRVAPFKAQNMSNNAAVCPGGGEIGRAQALQAAACGLAPSVDMNPILLKPQADVTAQVVLMGKPSGTLSALAYQARKDALLPMIRECLARLRATADLVILEGAGSPAEINLRDRDLVNMRAAALAGAPVLLVGDIDCGGIFAQLIGTMILLRPDERRRVRGLLINKFRGDASLMTSGLEFLAQETGVPVLGLLPYVHGALLPEEDAAALDGAAHAGWHRDGRADCVRIDVVRHPRIANFDDVDALRHEGDVAVRMIDRPPSDAGAAHDGRGAPDEAWPDAILLPGTKSTAADLRWLRTVGLGAYICAAARRGVEIVGICGGFQMLGHTVHDAAGVESATPVVRGLALLDAETHFFDEKRTTLVSGTHRESGLGVSGYEIHMGRTAGSGEPVFDVVHDGEHREPTGELARTDGLAAPGGRVWGTYLHGVFDEPAFRRHFVNRLRARRGLAPRPPGAARSLDAELERLADWAEAHIDFPALERIIAEGA